jgi:hypothetical protein
VKNLQICAKKIGTTEKLADFRFANNKKIQDLLFAAGTSKKFADLQICNSRMTQEFADLWFTDKKRFACFFGWNIEDNMITLIFPL